MYIKYADRIKNMEASELREFLKLSENNDIISFAGGFPAPEMFPVEKLKNITSKVLKKYYSISLQYGASEGYTPLRELIATNRMKRVSVNCNLENILITNGSQQGIEFSAKVFINKGDKIICERPTYLGALSSFKAYEPKFIEITTEEDGMNLEELENILKSQKNIKMIYTIPDFQNPSGITMSLEKRKKIATLAAKYKIPVIEDSPYCELTFENEILPSIKSFDSQGYVIYLGTFSKTFCPGLRIGWICAELEILKKYISCKQGSDLQASTFNQLITYEFLKTYDINLHIKTLRDVYKKRRDVMLEAINTYLPSEIKYTYPKGGLFTWLELPNNLNSKQVLNKAIKNKVAFVIGDAFFAKTIDTTHLRANYSCMSEEKIIEGIKRFGNTFDI